MPFLALLGDIRDRTGGLTKVTPLVTCAWQSRSPSSITKPSNLQQRSYLIHIYSRHRQSRAIYIRPTVNTVFIDKHGCSSVLMLRPHRLKQSSLICTHYALRTVSLVLGLSSRLTCSRDICSRSAVRASDTITRSFGRYLLTYWVTSSHVDNCCDITIFTKRPCAVTHFVHLKLLSFDQHCDQTFSLCVNLRTSWDYFCRVIYFQCEPSAILNLKCLTVVNSSRYLLHNTKFLQD